MIKLEMVGRAYINGSWSCCINRGRCDRALALVSHQLENCTVKLVSMAYADKIRFIVRGDKMKYFHRVNYCTVETC